VNWRSNGSLSECNAVTFPRHMRSLQSAWTTYSLADLREAQWVSREAPRWSCNLVHNRSPPCSTLTLLTVAECQRRRARAAGGRDGCCFCLLSSRRCNAAAAPPPQWIQMLHHYGALTVPGTAGERYTQPPSAPRHRALDMPPRQGVPPARTAGSSHPLPATAIHSLVESPSVLGHAVGEP
jgi:hypothetical protein